MIQKTLQKIENLNITPKNWIASFLSIIVIRIILESFSSGEGALFTITALPHSIFFFTSVILSFALIIHIFAKTNLKTTLNIVLIGWLISLTPPIVDLLVTSGKGGLTISYLFEPTSKLLETYIKLFFTENTKYFTYGVKAQALIGVIAVTTYTYIKTKKPLRTVLSAIATYTATYFFLILPTLLTIIETGKISVDNKDIFNFSFLPTEVFSIKIINPALVFDYKLSIFLAFILLFEITLLAYLHNKKILKEFFQKNIRWTRVFLSFISFSSGFFIAVRIFNYQKPPTALEVATIILSLIMLLLLWIYSFLINDREDFKIDTQTNKDRLLPKKLLKKETISAIAYISLGLSSIIAYLISLRMLTITLGVTTISYLYSVKPFRLKRFPFVSSLLIASTVALGVFAGYIFIAPDQSLKTFPKNLILLILLLFTLAVNTKDIKDEASDKKENVLTIPALFGEQKGKLILAILNAIGIILFGTLLSTNPILLVTTIITAAIVFLLTYDKNSKEKYILLAYSIFFVIAIFFAY